MATRGAPYIRGTPDTGTDFRAGSAFRSWSAPRGCTAAAAPCADAACAEKQSGVRSTHDAARGRPCPDLTPRRAGRSPRPAVRGRRDAAGHRQRSAPGPRRSPGDRGIPGRQRPARFVAPARVGRHAAGRVRRYPGVGRCGVAGGRWRAGRPAARQRRQHLGAREAGQADSAPAARPPGSGTYPGMLPSPSPWARPPFLASARLAAPLR